jgi:hypothetical protein
VVAIPEHLVFMGTWGRRTYTSPGGRSGDHDPSCRVWAVRPFSQRTKVRSRITSCLSGRTDYQMTP